MKVLTICLLFLATGAMAQRKKGFSVYLGPQFLGTVLDETAFNNPWGIGLSLQTFFPTNSKFIPSLEVNADAYLADDKVLRFDDNNQALETVDGVVGVYAGCSYVISASVTASVAAGPAFVNDHRYFGFKPGLALALPHKQRWLVKIFYQNIVNRTRNTNTDFGSIGFGLSRLLFNAHRKP